MVSRWDTADRLQSLTQGSAVVLLGFDDANRRTSLTFPNGIQATYAVGESSSACFERTSDAEGPCCDGVG